MPPSSLARLRKIALALSDAHEVQAWGAPTFRVNNKLFAMYAYADNQHTHGHEAVWVKSTPVNQSFMIAGNPKRYFSPPYVGTSGWVGVRLDGRVNWKEVADVVRDAYELTVAKIKRPRTSRARRSTKTTATPAKSRRTQAP